MTDFDDAGAIAALEAAGRHRVLRRLEVPEGRTDVEGDQTRARTAAVVDVETTGLSRDVDVVIELAIRRIRYDEAGRILAVGRSCTWLEDPGHDLDPGISRLTGLTDADLSGKAIDTAAAAAMLRSADVVVAHNAAFDRGFVERRLPDAAGLAWACSCREVDWAAAGYCGRGLGWLLAQGRPGHFHDGHRAAADVDALIQLLRTAMPDGRTAMRELLDTAGAPSLLVRATGAHFDVKDILRGRGYRWDPVSSVWGREVGEAKLTEEEFWLARNVYRSEHRPRASGPTVRPVTWFERHL